MDVFKNIFRQKPLILASGSPRRKELFTQAGLDFKVDVSDVEEIFDLNLSPEAIVQELSQQKAEAIAQKYENAYVVGADTIVVLDGNILGKPENEAHAESMLAILSGRTHDVFTGFSVIEKPEGRHFSGFEKTAVTFKPLTRTEISAYVATGSPMDKAGAYGIQDGSAIFVEKIAGCFYNVVGFPLFRFYEVCRKELS